ncbi:MAG: primosomal protein N', partial [Candidatus Limnocylindrales bacterium]
MTEPRFVEVAVDAPGVPGGRTFTYSVPASLSDLELGEAAMVEFGRRRAVGVVLAEGAEPPVEVKPLLARVRSEGALLGPLARRLALWVSEHYLAPSGLVVRAMLPPGTLERIELFAVARTSDDLVLAPEPLLEAVRAGGATGVAVSELPERSSGATLLRELRALEDEGALWLEWRVLPASVRPRQRRWAAISPDGRRAAAALAAGERPEGSRLGSRQRALLAELSQPGSEGADVAARLAERHGSSAVSSLAKRGLLELEVRLEERRPLAGRAQPRRGSRPAGSALDEEQAAAFEVVRAAIAGERHETVLLDGDTASGKTAVYAEAIAAALQAGRGALVLVPEIALATPLIDRLRHDLGEDVVMLHSAMSDGERADEWRRVRAGESRVVVGTRVAALVPPEPLGLVVVDEEHDAAYKSDRTPRYQARDVAMALGELAGVPVILGSATPDIVTVGRAREGQARHLRLRGRRSGAPVTIEIADMREELAEGNRGLLSATLGGALETLDTAAGDRAILMINRRGAASVVLCRDCGYVQICPECQRP